MSTKTTTQSYIGKEIACHDTFLNRELVKYKQYLEAINPTAEELKRIGLPPLTHDTVRNLFSRNYAAFQQQFEELAKADIGNIGFVFKAVSDTAIANGVDQLMRFFRSQELKLHTLEEFSDCPLIDGFAVLTDDFKNEVRERFTMRIKTEEGARYYEAYLRAEHAINEMLSMGALAGYHFQYGPKGELALLNICE
jgi:tetrahydrodipicolinate N-succinyltransferase